MAVLGKGMAPRMQLPLLMWVYIVDAALYPLGLVIAAVAVDRPGLALISLAPTIVLLFFARERRERLDRTLALNTAYRGTALLHDVGKIRVPKTIINKRGPLDEREWEIIRRHTIEGESMLKQVGGTLSSVGRIVRSDHERFDGRAARPDRAGDGVRNSYGGGGVELPDERGIASI